MRREFGYHRLKCDCKSCSDVCRFMPGYLIPADLERMIPEGTPDVMAWAEENLRASPGALVGSSQTGQMRRVPTLVPSSRRDHSCIHRQPDGRCGIHAVAPFGCAFFNNCGGQSDGVADALRREGIRAVLVAILDEGSLYYRILHHLLRCELTTEAPEVKRRRMKDALDLEI